MRSEDERRFFHPLAESLVGGNLVLDRTLPQYGRARRRMYVTKVRGSEFREGYHDYEILTAIPPEREAGFVAAADRAGVSVTRIGELAAGSGPTEVTLSGRRLRLARRAYVHRSGEQGKP